MRQGKAGLAIEGADSKTKQKRGCVGGGGALGHEHSMLF